MTPKFADKKLVNEVHSTLEAFAQALDLSDMVDLLGEALVDKANIKCQAAIFIGKVVKLVPPAQALDCAKKEIAKLPEAKRTSQRPQARKSGGKKTPRTKRRSTESRRSSGTYQSKRTNSCEHLEHGLCCSLQRTEILLRAD